MYTAAIFFGQRGIDLGTLLFNNPTTNQCIYQEARMASASLILGILPNYEVNHSENLFSRAVHTAVGITALLAACASDYIDPQPDSLISISAGVIDGCIEGIIYTGIRNRIINRVIINIMS